MLRRPTIAAVDEQENELSFDPNTLPTPSPNRSKYEGKFVKAREERRPLGEKTNSKLNKRMESNENGKVKENDSSKEQSRLSGEVKGKDKSSSSSSSSSSSTTTTTTTTISEATNNNETSFNEIFHLNSSKVEELTMALSETLKENEQLHDTISLLKAEIDRLNEEILEGKEYAELYLLGKELIENQAEEIENLKKKLVKRD